MDISATYVTGIMVTGKTPARFPLAKQAVEAWLRQDYPGPRGLLIINDHPTCSLYPEEPLPEGVVEVRLDNQQPLGALRNFGIELAPREDSYLVQWDDDDYSAPGRLSYQVQHTAGGAASIFQHEIHCNLRTGEAFVNNGKQIRSRGFPGTMLWPRSSSCRFPEKGKAEDTEFLLELRRTTPLRVLKNPPSLYTRFYHGLNTWSERHVMQRKRGSRDLTVAEQSHIQSLRSGPYSAILAGEASKEPEHNCN